MVGVRRAFPSVWPLSPLTEADHIQIPVFLAFRGPAELWSATRTGRAILLACHPEILLWIIRGRIQHKHLASCSPGGRGNEPGAVGAEGTSPEPCRTNQARLARVRGQGTSAETDSKGHQPLSVCKPSFEILLCCWHSSPQTRGAVSPAEQSLDHSSVQGCSAQPRVPHRAAEPSPASHLHHTYLVPPSRHQRCYNPQRGAQRSCIVTQLLLAPGHILHGLIVLLVPMQDYRHLL